MKKSLMVLFLVIAASLAMLIAFQNQRLKNPCADEKDSVGGSDAMKALDFWTAQRAFPERSIPDAGFYRAYDRIQEIAGRDNFGLNAADSWKSIGPANQGGRTIALAIDPQNPNMIYAGSASGGLWRLKMHGNSYSWESINTGYPVLGVNAIAIDPTNPKIIYIGTGEVYGYQNATGGLADRTTRGSYGIGLLKSTNRGVTWTKSIDWSYNQSRGILCIKIDPKRPNIVFAGTTEGVYRSTDLGKTWQKVQSVLMAVDLVINPISTNTVYVSCGNFGSSGNGIYRSMQGGKAGTWTKLGGGLPPSWSGKTLLTIYQKSPNILFADIADAFTSKGLYRSMDQGQSWERITALDYANYQGWYSHYARVHPTDPSKIFCAGINFYVSSNGGTNFSRKDEMHVDHHVYADHPTNPEIVYFGNDGGVYRTLDGGNTYQDLNEGYVTTQFYNGFSSSPTNPNLALGGLQDNSIVMYTGSRDWITNLVGGDGTYTAIDPQDNQTMYGSSQYLYMARTQDGGRSWIDIYQYFRQRNSCFVAPFILSPSQPTRLYAGEDIIYRSDNKGDSWSIQNSGNPLNGNPVISLTISHQNPDVVYAATIPSSAKRANIFSTRDGGLTWKNITGDLPNRYYIDLQVSPQNDNILYTALGGFGTSHLFRTKNDGATWEDIGKGLPDFPTSAVIVDPATPTTIYVGNDQGIYVSKDNGQTWQSFNQGLPPAVIVMDLSISRSNNKIRAVTHGNGIFERSLLAHIE